MPYGSNTRALELTPLRSVQKVCATRFKVSFIVCVLHMNCLQPAGHHAQKEPSSKEADEGPSVCTCRESTGAGKPTQNLWQAGT